MKTSLATRVAAVSWSGAALAHGGHVEMSAPTHDAFHGGVAVGLVLIVAALALAWIKERRT